LIFENEFFKPDEWDYSPEWKVKFEKIIKDYGMLTVDDKKKLDKMDWWRFLMNHDIPQKDLDIREYSDSTDFGESIRFVSAYAALAEYAESNENNEMDYKIEGGNSKLATALSEKTGLEKIKLNHKAVSVNYETKVTVVCSNGQRFEADSLICAIPTYSISKISWNPLLPQNKIDAINALQYSRINKSATIFKERFWKDESFSIITDSFAHYFYHGTKYQSSERGVLISYSIGDKADMLSHLKGDEKEKTITDSLYPAFGDVGHLIENNINY
jgi:monoamine oxidase